MTGNLECPTAVGGILTCSNHKGTLELNEAQARQIFIDPGLRRAGWNLDDHTQVLREVPVDGYDATPWNGVTDYCFYNPSGAVIAVVEAKRTCRNPREGEEQLRHYVTEIAKRQAFAPFGFLTNGLLSYFWDVDAAHPRLVAGMFSPDDLERFRFIRENAKPPALEQINNAIVNRAYQHEAIRRAAEAFAAGKRRALLIMATGTGKTRTTMGLIDVFLRSSSAQKVLFLADRDALVEQALNDGFKAHLPHEPRVRIHTANIDRDKRLYVATLQTMSRCFEQFSPGFFDLIVFDEAHRSIFNRFTEVIEYFDARMIGLTATPAHFIDRDTFRVFECRDGVPTYLYTYPQAVAEKQLVDFRLYQAQTGFQRKGIKGVDLDEEGRDLLAGQGLDPDAIDYSGTELEVLVTNRDTLRRQWEEIMEVCIKDRAGHLPGKTIVFAMTKEHAERVRDVFEEMYPQYFGVLQVIHHGMERVHNGSYGDGLITKFKKNDKPRIAVSVDMLDTGIDVPEVVNLVFMKPVQSRIKLWQMIGRGTRNQEACRFFDRLPNGEKTEFLIIDFWQNNFGKQTEDRVPVEVPLLIRLFNTRLDILAASLNQPEGAAHTQALADCRAMIGRIPVESFPVRKVWAEVEAAWTDAFWSNITREGSEALRLKVAPLLRFVPDVDIAAETFTHKVERLNLQKLKDQASPELLLSIAKDVSRLPQHVLDATSKQLSVKLARSKDLAKAGPSQLHRLIVDLADDMKKKRRVENSFIKIDLPDFIAGKGYLLIDPSGQPMHVEEYRKRVEQRILGITDRHPALVAIRASLQPDEGDLVDLERVLHNELSNPEIQLTEKTARQAYGVRLDNRAGFLGFVRYVLDLDAIPDYAAVVAHSFEDHITANRYSSDQIRFLRSVQEVFIAKRRLAEADLYEAPLTSFGRNAVERYFTPDQIRGLVQLTDRLTA
jgi:type I restriction enzyme R subunit